MNIAIVTTWFERGAAYVSKQIADTLISSGDTVFIYARGGEDIATNKAPWNQYAVERDNTPRLPMPTGMNKRKFTQFLRKYSIDLVIFNEQRYWAPLLWAHELGIPCVAYIDYYTAETIDLFNAYDALICNTKRHYSVFKKHRACFFVPWGTDITIFSPYRSHPNETQFTFFHSAGMNPHRKGTDFLILAIQKLSKRRTDFSTLIHTQVSLEKFFPELLNTINDLTNRGILSIVQRTVSAPGLYRKGKIYVYPSRLDGIGLTIPEALSCGLPVITTDSPPMNEFILETHGKLVKLASSSQRKDEYYWPETSCNTDDLAEKMNSYCEQQEAIAVQSIAARQYAMTYLDWNENSRMMPELLKQVKLSNTILELKDKLAAADNKSVPHYSLLSYIYNAIFRFAISCKGLLK